jgi:nicotinate-nucleotide pyrophosphorylase (carboxylating)
MQFADIQELIQRAFQEDFVYEDITSSACIDKDARAKAKILLKQEACIAALQFLPSLFQLYDPRIKTEVLIPEGTICKSGTILAFVEGPARSLLSAERVALNLLQHASGVATLTAKCVAKAKGTSCQILDTRKTILGLRLLQKYAVRMGGGTNHRMHLKDRILIKNNHLTLCKMKDCIRLAREKFPSEWIEVEVSSQEELQDAINAGVNACLLDNMSPEIVQSCVAFARKKVFLEASGGITLDNLTAYATTGVDGISIGALTHSAPAVDISMRII